MSNSQSKFVKQVLVEEAEYDRLRQNHYRNYSPQIRTMDKLQEFIYSTMMRTDLDPQQKIDLCSGPRQRFNQLREETATLNGDNTGKSSGAAAPKVPDKPVAKPKAEPIVAEAKEEPMVADVEKEPIVEKNEEVKVDHPKVANRLMDLIGNNPNIIRRNDDNEMEINGHAVPGTNFDELYANLFSIHGTQHLPGMRELIGALRQLNVESGDIVSHPIKAAYESAVPRTGPLHHNEKAVPKAPKPKTKSKRRSTSPFEIDETEPSKHATRSTTKYNMPRKGLSNLPKNQQSGKGITFPPRILYVY